MSRRASIWPAPPGSSALAWAPPGRRPSRGRELADALGAEIACTRPVAEDRDWLPTERYIGISGASVRPDLYLGLGVSGQVQHTFGIRDAKIIVGVNTNPDAPLFGVCDYAVVGTCARSRRCCRRRSASVGQGAPQARNPIMSVDDDAVDVIVVGAGLAGIACAYRLALAGQSVSSSSAEPPPDPRMSAAAGSTPTP